MRQALFLVPDNPTQQLVFTFRMLFFYYGRSCFVVLPGSFTQVLALLEDYLENAEKKYSPVSCVQYAWTLI